MYNDICKYLNRKEVTLMNKTLVTLSVTHIEFDFPEVHNEIKNAVKDNKVKTEKEYICFILYALYKLEREADNEVIINKPEIVSFYVMPESHNRFNNNDTEWFA